MRILVISNLYPPHYIGGYELCCQDVVELLRAKGHNIKVLTSTYGTGKYESTDNVYRLLNVQFCWEKSTRLKSLARMMPFEIHNQRVLRDVCHSFCPDVVFIWNLAGLSLSLAFLPQHTGIPVTFYILDDWLLSYYKKKQRNIAYRISNRLFNLFLNALNYETSSGDLDFSNLVFVSQFLKKSYTDFIAQAADAMVIHLGIDIEKYPFRETCAHPQRLLYVGQIVPHKGVHTAVEALKTVVQEGNHKDVTMTIAGGTVMPDYEAKLKKLIGSLDIEEHIRFTGPMARETIAAIYKEHDILIFPSIWDEPLGMVPLEAMASGLAVIGTGAGGSSEILNNDINALTFPKEDAGSCATQILRLITDKELYDRIRRQGRRTIKDHFGWDTIINRIENALNAAITSQ